MKKEKKTQRRRFDAKKTAVGRFVCRLIGDTAGQALMEYVVLGVLVVAAVVAIVILFGDGIQYQFRIMYHSMLGHTTEVQRLIQERDQHGATQEPAATDAHNNTNGGQSGGSASGTGPSEGN